MIEIIVKQYLEAQIYPVPVRMEVPNPEPEKYVLIEKTNRSEENKIEAITIRIKSVAPSLYEAASLSESVVAAMKAAPAHTGISKSKLNTEYNSTDTARKQYAYAAIFNLIY